MLETPWLFVFTAQAGSQKPLDQIHGEPCGEMQGLSDWVEIHAEAANQTHLTDLGTSSGAGAVGQ